MDIYPCAKCGNGVLVVRGRVDQIIESGLQALATCKKCKAELVLLPDFETRVRADRSARPRRIWD